MNTDENIDKKHYKGIIVIGGGAGFIGSHLSDYLVKEYEVIVIDNLSTANFANIEYLLQKPNFEFIRHDLNNPIDLNETPEGKRFDVAFRGVDTVFQLSFPIAPADFLKTPVQTLMDSAQITCNLLALAKLYNARFVLGSSGAVYGRREDNSNASVREEYEGKTSTIDTLSCYIEGQRFAESLTINYRREHNIDAKIARIFSPYGPRMKLGDGREISDFVKSAIASKPIIIYGDENASVTLCHIDDVVSALIALMRSDEIGPINIGDTRVYLLREIAEAVLRLTESRSEIEYRPIPKSWMREYAPDIGRAKERLNWLPLTPLERGLVETVSALRASKVVSVDYAKLAGKKVPKIEVPKGR